MTRPNTSIHWEQRSGKHVRAGTRNRLATNIASGKARSKGSSCAAWVLRTASRCADVQRAARRTAAGWGARPILGADAAKNPLRWHGRRAPLPGRTTGLILISRLVGELFGTIYRRMEPSRKPPYLSGRRTSTYVRTMVRRFTCDGLHEYAYLYAYVQHTTESHSLRSYAGSDDMFFKSIVCRMSYSLELRITRTYVRTYKQLLLRFVIFWELCMYVRVE